MNPIKVDIVSDIVCPWCVIGYKQLQSAANLIGKELAVHWHPFELNPQMTDAGQNLQEHISEKYGTTIEQSNVTREKLTRIGKALDFPFVFTEQSRIVNTYKAHQLLHWANIQAREHELKLALFSAYFTEQQDINNTDVLLATVAMIGLNPDEAMAVLNDGRYRSEVRRQQKLWTGRGIDGVPAMVFNDQFLVTGAQGVENYTEIFNQIDSESSALG